jgi:hypothetical protein
MQTPTYTIPRDDVVAMISGAASAAGVTGKQRDRLLEVARTGERFMVGNFQDVCDCPWQQAFGSARGGGDFATAFDERADQYILSRPHGPKSKQPFAVLKVAAGA